MQKTLFFDLPGRNITGRDMTELFFPFRLVDDALIGSPEEMNRSSNHLIKVGVSGSLSACWDLTDDQLLRVMFEYGKRHVIQKVKDGTLGDEEELELNTYNAECPCPFDPSRLENPINAVVKINTTAKKIMENKTFLQLASAIIDARDNINAVFFGKYKDKLIIVGEERDLLQFFRDAETQEEFFFRMCALANAVTKMNIECLRKLTKITDKDFKSIKLLEEYLKKKNISDSKIIDVFRNINKMRQGYPVHGDRVKGVIDAHNYFSLDYPVTNYSAAWKTLLTYYRDSLHCLLENLKDPTDSRP